MAKIDLSTAETEVNAWLDFRKVKESKRTALKPSIDAIVEGIMDGVIIIDPTSFEVIQKLNFPIATQDVTTDSIVFSSRVTTGEITKQIDGINSQNPMAVTIAYIAALTKKPKAFIEKMDSVDNAISGAIASFFM